MSEAAAPSGFGSLGDASRLLSDDRLVRRATKGDERAFAAIFRRYHQDLYRFCLAIVGDSQDAQDALQNTMVKVMRALPGERRHIQLKPWLYRIAHNESIEVLRRRPPSEELDPELATTSANPAEEAEQRARLRRLIADMEELPERQRGALVMRELADLEFEEIGTALGTSAAVARQTLYEARLSLRQMEEGRELSCDAVTRALSDADGRVTRRRDIRAHVRACPSCREFRDELRRRRGDFAALAPLPALAAAGILQGILGGSGSGGAAVGTAGGAAATAGKAAGVSALGGSALVKGAATVAVVAVIGAGAADRSGLVDVGLPGGAGAKQAPASSGGGGGDGSSSDAAPGVSGQGGTQGGAQGGTVGGAAAKNGKGVGPAGHGAGAAAPAGSGAAAHGAHGAPSSDSPGASAAHRNEASQGNLPSAADHGQQTAESHKGGNGGGGNGAANGNGSANGNGGGSSGSHGQSGSHAQNGSHANNGGQGGGGGGGATHAQPATPPKPAPPPASSGGQQPTSPEEASAGQGPAVSPPGPPEPPKGAPKGPQAAPAE